MDISINLDTFVSVRTKMNGKNGEVAGIFIPFEPNNLNATADSCYVNFHGFDLKEPKIYKNQKQIAFLKQSLPKAKYAEMTKEERYVLPIFGNVSEYVKDASAPEIGIGTVPVEDLPF